MIFTFVNTIVRWTLAKEVLIRLKIKYENLLKKEFEMKDMGLII